MLFNLFETIPEIEEFIEDEVFTKDSAVVGTKDCNAFSNSLLFRCCANPRRLPFSNAVKIELILDDYDVPFSFSISFNVFTLLTTKSN